jgi:Protein of unknown function (DUF1236)
MNRSLIAATTALTIGFAASALAQSAVVTIAPEQRTTIKQYVVKEKVKPITVKERISVGATLPGDVELQTVPSAWGPTVSKYRYVYSNDNVYLVEPDSRRVVTIID